MSSEKSAPKARPEPTSDINVLHERLREDPRFNPPTPSVWKRLTLLIIVFILFWVAYSIKPLKPEPPKPTVVHANR